MTLLKHVAAFKALAVLGWMIALTWSSIAFDPAERLSNPALEARAQALSAEFRCLVCQNQSVNDSDAALARDIRRLVREKISAGEQDQAIRDFLVQRYGEFVLLSPPKTASTMLLWWTPWLAVFAGLALVGRVLLLQHRRYRTESPAQEDKDT